MTQSSLPTVSIVMATYNGERFLREQLDSIIAQTYSIYELIIQDDCSNDSTKSIIEEYASKYSFIHAYHNETNLGFKKNFETACAHATGEYIAFSDQDDIWLPNHIEVLVNLIGDKSLACGNALLVDSENQDLGFTLQQEHKMTYIPSDDIKKAYKIFYGNGCYQGASMLVRRKSLKAMLPIPDGVKYHDIWITTNACLFDGMNYTNSIITRYRQHDKNVTSHFKPSIYKELIRHTHTDFMPDRVDLCKALSNMNPRPDSLAFLKEFKLYATRHTLLKYRWWCWRFRSRHYKDIYCTKSNKYKLLRAVQYLLTPSCN